MASLVEGKKREAIMRLNLLDMIPDMNIMKY